MKESVYVVGIYLVCYLIFPAVVMFEMKRATPKETLLEKKDTDVIKGIATCFIILAHLIIPLKTELHGVGLGLNVYTFTGGMGVLLFFFVSGYGIWKGYGKDNLKTRFWSKRLLNMYFPCVFIQLLFSLVRMTQEGCFGIKELLVHCFLGAWFIDVIMIQYFVFYIAHKISKNNKGKVILLSFLFSVVIAMIFWANGFNPRWYNGLLLFPTGMLAAYKERELISFTRTKWGSSLSICGFSFIFWGGVFAYGKDACFGIGSCKVLAGICLCAFICILYMRIEPSSGMMRYIGKRSLFFYLIHMNILEICGRAGISKVDTFYIVILLSFVTVELSYQLYRLFRTRREKQADKDL